MSPMKTIRSLALLALCAAPLAACQEVGLVDDVDLTFDWKQLIGPSDALHSPYVAGSSFSIYVTTAKKQSLTRWTMVSGDEGVMKLGTPTFSDDHESMWVPVQTKSAGIVDLSVFDSADELRHRHRVEVKVPDRIDVLAHGQLLIDHDAEAPTDQPQILGGGTATFLMRYYAGGEQLSGNGALAVTADGAVGAHLEQSFLFEDRDWLQISPDASLTQGSIDLLVAGQPVRSLPISVVPESAIARIELIGEDESHADKGEWLVVLAQAFDASDGFIYGVDYKFTTDGVRAIGNGDLYRYSFDRSKPVMLEAAHAGHTNGVVIRSGGGFVDSTNRIGCGFSPGPASTNGLAGFLVLAACALGLRRRRARSHDI